MKLIRFYWSSLKPIAKIRFCGVCDAIYAVNAYGQHTHSTAQTKHTQVDTPLTLNGPISLRTKRTWPKFSFDRNWYATNFIYLHTIFRLFICRRYGHLFAHITISVICMADGQALNLTIYDHLFSLHSGFLPQRIKWNSCSCARPKIMIIIKTKAQLLLWEGSKKCIITPNKQNR